MELCEVMLTRKEICDHLQICRKTLNNWQRRGLVLINGRTSIAAVEVWRFYNPPRYKPGMDGGRKRKAG